MARSQVRHNVKDAAGNVVQNALCYVYETTTTTPVADLFAASSGGSALPSLTSDAQGDIVGWLDVARTVDIKVTDNTHTAYYPSTASRLLRFADFTETMEVAPAQGAVDASVAAEAVLRASADTSEATTRATADTTNATAITTETTARAAADTAHNISAGAHTNLPYESSGGAGASDQVLKMWVAGENYELTSITRDSDEVPTTATVKWPDGSGGTFTTVTKNATWLVVDAFTISHTLSGKTVTQAAVTRDAGGAVTTKPAMTVA